MYRALKNFIHHGIRVKVGDKINYKDGVQLPKQAIPGLVERGCIYKSKEDKRVYERQTKATIEHDGGPMFIVKKGNQVIDRLKKSEAEALRDEINAEK